VVAGRDLNPSGIAWEAQLSPITDDDIRYRTERYDADDADVCWVSPAWPSVDRAVPSP
jgi:hypothetical protein